jgi:tetratricopeptide (TPR) repeat protein
VSRRDRIRRQHLLREAEGYLELVEHSESGLEASVDSRFQMARRSLATLERVPRRLPANSSVYFLKARCCVLMGELPEAVRQLRRCIRRDEENIPAWLLLGACYRNLDRLERAVESLEQALGYAPDEAAVHYDLACYLSLLEHVQLAVLHLERALDLEPTLRDRIAGDGDFDPIRADPAFRAALRRMSCEGA